MAAVEVAGTVERNRIAVYGRDTLALLVEAHIVGCAGRLTVVAVGRIDSPVGVGITNSAYAVAASATCSCS